LRNAGLRPRLFHNGQSPFPTNRSPLLVNLSAAGLTQLDMRRIEDFIVGGLTDPRTANALPPFDRPTLRRETLPQPTSFGLALPGTTTPAVIDTTPTFLGNADWKVGFAAGDGVTPAYVALSLQAPPAPILLSGIPLNVGPAITGVFLFLGGAPGRPGVGTYRLPIPGVSIYLGTQLFVQVFAADAGAPGGIAASKGWMFTVR
jgi:hypothetical protein